VPNRATEIGRGIHPADVVGYTVACVTVTLTKCRPRFDGRGYERSRFTSLYSEETIMRARVLLAVLLLAGAAGLTRADDKPLDRAELDKRVVSAVYDAALLGTDIFNRGDYGGCYRLYQGTLFGVAPMLDHRPKLQATVKERLKRAEKMKVTDGAFELRTALDEIQNEIAPPKDGPKKTLWDRLGGETAVTAVVRDFVLVAIDDPKVNFFRGKKFDAKTTLPAVQKSLVEFVSSATGGPLKYTGKSMKEAHKGMGITDAEFDALAADLATVLKKYKVPQAETDEVMKLVGSTRGDIVEKAPEKLPIKTLWERLGGEKAVKAVVHDFVVSAATNKKVNFTRNGKYKLDDKAVEHLEKTLVELISQTTGGPLKYSGKSMKEAHKGMGITDAEFDALATDFIDSLKKFKVPQPEIDELVKIVAGTRADIVEKN
jgi:hemoglobin